MMSRGGSSGRALGIEDATGSLVAVAVADIAMPSRVDWIMCGGVAYNRAVLLEMPTMWFRPAGADRTQSRRHA